ncbi:class I SAM-dependent methyltransferase [Streptomyces californicus]|uniref:class I SAM-dependent methyltransferase n=1 Tax=Streptomyces californicus TaxID=67351 RepID=UPI0036BD7810
MHTHHSTPGRHEHERASESTAASARLLELDGEVLTSYYARLTGRLADLAGDPAPSRILDLGSGPGTGTLALAGRFPAARVTAVDISPRMLHRLRKRAASHGIADRVDTVEANADEPWTFTGVDAPYDLVWAAAFLHHVGDPVQTLEKMYEALRPGGLVAVTEMDFFPRHLPENAGVGRPGLEARLHAATNTEPPHEWSDQLRAAGFVLLERRPYEIHLDRAQAGPRLNAYAQSSLGTLRSHAAGLLGSEDLDALDALLDETHPHGVARREDLSVRTTRTAWIARRP